MRKAFRTTIDDDVLLYLKKQAVEQGVHVNDIIENLVLDKIQEQYLEKSNEDFLNMSELQKNNYIERKLTNVIRNVLNKYCKKTIYPINLPEIVSKAIVDIIKSNDMFPPKK